MSVRVYLREYVDLDDLWMNKQDWLTDYDGKPDELVELLNEYLGDFLDECGGIEGLIGHVEWVD